MTSRLNDLIGLAHEPSSARRRELLRGVTNLFFESHEIAPNQAAMFDAMMVQLASEMEAAVLAELSARLAASPAPPPGISRRLATDDILVAGPMLSGGAALPDELLLEVARTRSQDHLRAISKRRKVSSVVSDVIVERGDDDTLNVLLRNDGATLSREAHEAVVDRASENPELHEAVVSRKSVPIDLLNEMYFTVEARLRDQIQRRNADLDPAELDAALSASRQQVQTRDGALPSDYADAQRVIRHLKNTGGISPQSLASMLRTRQITQFLVALSELADVDFHTARRILERKELDVLAIVCKAAGFDRALFLTFVMLILDNAGNAVGRAREYADQYVALPLDSARRTIQFWKMRRQTGDVAAA